MTDSALRQRVQRFLRGDINPEDLSTLFLFLRNRSHGMQTVREMGDFVAHSEEREKGITTDMTRAFFSIMRLQMPFFDADGRVDLNDLPPDFFDGIRASFHTADKNLVRQETGLKQKQAEKTLRSLLAKFGVACNGRISIQQPLIPQENSLLRSILGSFRVLAAFDENRLVTEFSLALIRNGLLEENEKNALAERQAVLVLYAIAKMHRSRIVLGASDWADLSLGLTGEERVCIVASANCPTKAIPHLRMAAPMFDTSLPASESCDQAVLLKLRTNPNPDPIANYGIEINGYRKLAIIG